MEMAESVTTTPIRKKDENIVSELTPEHYELMHKVREEWMDRALKGGSSIKVEDIRDDINWIYETMGDMKTNKPKIIVCESYAMFELVYNLLKIVGEDTTGKLNKTNKNALETPVMANVWDLLWYGQHGSSIHEALDSNIKKDLQEKIWEIVARSSGDGVGMSVWDVIRQNLTKSLTETLWVNLWKMIAIPGAETIRSKVTQKVWDEALTQLAHYIGGNINQPIRRQLESVLEGIVSKSNNQLQFADHFIGLGNWTGWWAFYDFFVQAGILRNEKGEIPEEWIRFRRLVWSGIWTTCFFSECVLVCALPTRVRRDEVSKQLHSLEGPAIEWADGTGQYFIWGINFSESLIDNLGTPPAMWKKIANNELTWTEIFGLKNIEQRRIAVRRYGAEKILNDAKAKLMDRSIVTGNELYKIEAQIAVRDVKGKVTFKANDQRTNTDETHTLIPEMRVMRYKDFSTDRIYHSFVPNSINKADDGMAWKFQVTTDAYVNKLKVQS